MTKYAYPEGHIDELLHNAEVKREDYDSLEACVEDAMSIYYGWKYGEGIGFWVESFSLYRDDTYFIGEVSWESEDEEEESWY